MFESDINFVDPITRQPLDFASEIPSLCHHTILYQLDLEKENSWYQPLLDFLPFDKPLLFKATELGHFIQFPTFDTRRAGRYMKKIRDFIAHASASDTVLKKPTGNILTQGNTVCISNP